MKEQIRIVREGMSKHPDILRKILVKVAEGVVVGFAVWIFPLFTPFMIGALWFLVMINRLYTSELQELIRLLIDKGDE